MDKFRHTTSYPWQRLASDIVTTDYAVTLQAEDARPTSNIIDLVAQNSPLKLTTNKQFTDDSLTFIPIGSNGNNQDFHMRIIGWNPVIHLGNNSQDIWIPTLLCELVVTLGNIPLANMESDFYAADTISMTYGSTDWIKVYSPGNDVSAYVTMDLQGARLLQVDVDKDAGVSEAASANLLWRTLN